MLSVLHSQTHVYRWLQDGNEVRLVDCGPKTADDDVLQTPKPTDTVRTDTMRVFAGVLYRKETSNDSGVMRHADVLRSHAEVYSMFA